jgi:hypothetical protein
VIQKDGRPVLFALHGFIEFSSLADLFPYIEAQAWRWKGSPDFDDSDAPRTDPGLAAAGNRESSRLHDR